MISIGNVPIKVSREAEEKINAMRNDEEGGKELFLFAIKNYNDFKRTGEIKYTIEIAKVIGRYGFTLADFIKWIHPHPEGA